MNEGSSSGQPTPVFLGIGSNVGDRYHAFQRALESIVKLPGTTLRRLSPLYYTDPINVGGGDFLNGVLQITTDLRPEALWRKLEDIERRLGRDNKGLGQPRTIDLDILMYGDEIIETEHLQIPHPRMTQRAFVLRPLVDLAADIVIPRTNQTPQQLLEALDDQSGVRPAPAACGEIDLSRMI